MAIHVILLFVIVDRTFVYSYYWQIKQVLKKETELHVSPSENGGLNSKTMTTNKDGLFLQNVHKVPSAQLRFFSYCVSFMYGFNSKLFRSALICKTNYYLSCSVSNCIKGYIWCILCYYSGFYLVQSNSKEVVLVPMKSMDAIVPILLKPAFILHFNSFFNLI